MLEELPGYDQWLTNTDAGEKEPRAVDHCFLCKQDLYEGQECYFINGDYYCESCIDDAKVLLDVDEMYWRE